MNITNIRINDFGNFGLPEMIEFKVSISHDDLVALFNRDELIIDKFKTEENRLKSLFGNNK